MFTISVSLDENGIPRVSVDQSEAEPIRCPEKKKSMISFPDDFIVIDVETTGLDVRFCEIIEISAIRYRAGSETEVFHSLVKPSEPIDEFITSLTGITNEMLESAPDISSVISDFYNFVGSETLVGYNVNFDINFLYDNLMIYKSLPLTNNFIDVMRISKRLLPDLENHKLLTVAKHFKTSAPSHRSLDDCRACFECFQRLRDEAIRQFGSVDAFLSAFPARKHNLSAKDITATTTNFDESNPLYGKNVCFTGALEKMIRRDAMQLVVNLGGVCSDNVNKHTNYLVIGNNDFCASIKDGKSNKQKKAEALILKGSDLEILSESAFYDMVLDQ